MSFHEKQIITATCQICGRKVTLVNVKKRAWTTCLQCTQSKTYPKIR